MESKEETSIFAALLAIIAAGIALFYTPYVLTQLWLWFVVPTFGLPVLTIPLAMGLCLVAQMLTGAFNKADRPETEASLHVRAVQVLLMPAVLHGMGWLIAQYV